MERAARLIRSTTNSDKLLSDDDLARAVWPAAVGKAIASHTVRVKLVRSKLLVEVEDAIWQRQLFPLSAQILGRLRQVLGRELVEELEFRIAIPRRGMMREEPGGAPESRVAGGPEDEAERIQDPVLKKVYRMSRKKATA